MTQERGGSIESDMNSANYSLKMEIAHPGVGSSNSANYIYDHGTFWMSNSSLLRATIQWVDPEFRVGADATNDDAKAFLTILTADDLDDTVLFTSDLFDIANDGTYSTEIDLTGINPGTYDVGIKGHQHITKKLDDIALVSGNNVLNFTQVDNSAPRGVEKLIAGDIDGDILSPATMGDDFINSVDLTALLANFNASDPTGNVERVNINQDIIVNSVDLTAVLSNFNMQGEK